MEIDGILREHRENSGCNIDRQKRLANITDKSKDTPAGAKDTERIRRTVIAAAVISQIFFLDLGKNKGRLDQAKNIASSYTIQ